MSGCAAEISPASSITRALVDRAFERAAEGDADRHSRPNPVGASALDDPERRVHGLADRRVLVPPIERLRGAEGEASLVEAARDEAVVAALVEREPRVHDAALTLERRHDLLGARHLRHASGIDEARDLHCPNPCGDDPADELGSELGREDFGLVLEAVTRPHVETVTMRLVYPSAFVFRASSRSRSVMPPAVCVHQRSVTCL